MINLIVAVSSNNVIGVNNTLPWKLSADMKRFKELTTGNAVIMGRKTFESIGRKLPNRENIVVTRKSCYQVEAPICVAGSLLDAFSIANNLSKSTIAPFKEIFIIGGGEIYKEVLDKNLIDRIYLTRVHTVIDGDTYFPAIDRTVWDLIDANVFLADEKNQFSYTFETYKKYN